MNRSDFIAGNPFRVEEDNFKPKMSFGRMDGDYKVTIKLIEKMAEGWLCMMRRRHRDTPGPRNLGNLSDWARQHPAKPVVISVRDIKNLYRRFRKKDGTPFDGIEGG